MSDQSWFARTIVESHETQQTLDLFRSKYKALEEVWDGLCWILARKAEEVGEEYKGYRIYKSRGNDGEWTVPSITALYQVREHEVEILSILIALPEELDELDF